MREWGRVSEEGGMTKIGDDEMKIQKQSVSRQSYVFVFVVLQ